MTTLVTNIRKTRLPQRYLAYVRHVGPYMGNTELFGRMFEKVRNWAANRGLITEDTEAIAVYHDDCHTVPEDKQRISMGFTVPEGTVVTEGLELMTIPAGDYLIGSFELLPHEYEEAWTEMTDFIRNEGVDTTAWAFETYRNDPITHPQGIHMVDICIGIR